MNSKKILCGLLIMSMLLSLTGMLTGCGKAKNLKKKPETSAIVAEGVLNSDNLTLSHQGLSMRISPVTLSTDAEAIIIKVSDAPALDDGSDIKLEVYDFSLSGADKPSGVIELMIPLKLEAGALPGAAYFNEDSGKWEPVSFRYDSAAGAVVITTDHLSKYGVFSISGQGKHKARIQFLGIAGASGNENFVAAVEEYAKGGVPASKCVEIGAEAVGDALQLSGDILGNAAQSTGYLAYGDDVMATLGDHLGSIGLMVSAVQIGTNIADGKIHEALVGSMKTAWTYIMGKASSKLSSSVMSASMAAVAIVDYSINKFGTEALEGRASIYRDAYSIYYQKGEPGYRSAADWYNNLYPLFASGNLSESELKAEIDRMVTAHCEEFWGGGNKDGVDAYVDEAREKMAWTGGQAGLNDTVRKDISAERRAIVYNDILPVVFNQIAKKLNLENEKMLRAEYQKLSAYMNTPISFSLTDKQKTYAGHTVRFAPLNGKAKAEGWTGTINDNGLAKTTFTLYGHMYAGAPNTLEIYEPGTNPDGAPVKTVTFKVTPPIINVVIDEDPPAKPEQSGNSSSNPQTEQPGQQPVGKKYAWVLVDTVTNNAKEDIDHTNSGGVYQAAASASPGSYTYSHKYIGETDTYPDPDQINGEGYAMKLDFSVPPTVIQGGETVTLSFNLAFTEQNVSYFDGNGSCRADLDSARFVNKAGKNLFEIYCSAKYSKKNVLSVSDTLTATAPSGGTEGDRIEIWTGGPSGKLGTTYVYEWRAQ